MLKRVQASWGKCFFSRPTLKRRGRNNVRSRLSPLWQVNYGRGGSLFLAGRLDWLAVWIGGLAALPLGFSPVRARSCCAPCWSPWPQPLPPGRPHSSRRRGQGPGQEPKTGGGGPHDLALPPGLGRNGRGAWRGLATARPCYLPRPIAPIVTRRTIGGPCSGIWLPWGNNRRNNRHVTSDGLLLGTDSLKNLLFKL